MVEYNEWTEAVHEAYKAKGGTYGEDTASRLVELAAEFWRRHKQELLELAFDAAVELAKRKLDL